MFDGNKCWPILITDIHKISSVRGNNWNIGKNGELPWQHIKEDMKVFTSLTTDGNNPGVVMGRNTWESLPERHRPLKGRVNIVMSRTLKVIDNAFVACDFNESISIARQLGIDTLWAIGGNSIYNEFLGAATEVYINRIDTKIPECDVKFPFEDLVTFYKRHYCSYVQTDSYNFTMEKWLWDVNNVKPYCNKG